MRKWKLSRFYWLPWMPALMVLAVLVGIVVGQSTAPAVSWSAPAASTTACGTSGSTTYTAALCVTTAGVYLSTDGGQSWQGPLLVQAPAAPVQSVFGRTGNVVAAGNDYQFGQLAGQTKGSQIGNMTCNYTGTVSNSGGSITLGPCN